MEKREKRKRGSEMSAAFILRSPQSPVPGVPTPLVSVSWIGLCVTSDCVYVRKSEKERDLTTSVPLLMQRGRERRCSQIIFNLSHRLFLLLATPPRPESGGLDLGLSEQMLCMVPTISPGTSISHSPRPPHLPESGPVTLRALQGCP